MAGLPHRGAVQSRPVWSSCVSHPPSTGCPCRAKPPIRAGWLSPVVVLCRPSSSYQRGSPRCSCRPGLLLAPPTVLPRHCGKPLPPLFRPLRLSMTERVLHELRFLPQMTGCALHELRFLPQMTGCARHEPRLLLPMTGFVRRELRPLPPMSGCVCHELRPLLLATAHAGPQSNVHLTWRISRVVRVCESDHVRSKAN